MFTTAVGVLYGVAVLLIIGAIITVPVLLAATFYRWSGRAMPARPPLALLLVLFGVGAFLISLD